MVHSSSSPCGVWHLVCACRPALSLGLGAKSANCLVGHAMAPERSAGSPLWLLAQKHFCVEGSQVLFAPRASSGAQQAGSIASSCPSSSVSLSEIVESVSSHQGFPHVIGSFSEGP